MKDPYILDTMRRKYTKFASKYMLYMTMEEELKREINRDREIFEFEERMYKDEE
ncbi:hypothetical protein [Clostridium cochlearium]|uniref:hypothetical protein n=1 Tax=Clostridium cochlearium TaxID=1494 RepID=UPI00241E0D3E|nr:hypothetical protein [Clostridium cochlearium]